MQLQRHRCGAFDRNFELCCYRTLTQSRFGDINVGGIHRFLPRRVCLCGRFFLWDKTIDGIFFDAQLLQSRKAPFANSDKTALRVRWRCDHRVVTLLGFPGGELSFLSHVLISGHSDKLPRKTKARAFGEPQGKQA